jgi:hypothetical protein
MRITEVTRRRLIEGLGQRRTAWSGVLDEAEFLGRLYDLDALPSTDSRFSSARGDVYQHRVLNPFDWEDDWIFSDPRFGLADSDDALVRFLAEVLHPAVRTDLSEVEELRVFLNSVLIHDGYEIVQTGDISGAPVFEGRRTGSGVRGSMKNIIFAAVGPKPVIVIDDAVNNDLRIVKNEKNCLIYDRPLGARGLTWRALADWEKLTGQPERTIWSSLYQRLLRSIAGNGAERRIFTAYGKRYGASLAGRAAAEALIRAFPDHFECRAPGDEACLERLRATGLTSSNPLCDLVRDKVIAPEDALPVGLTILAALADLACTSAFSVLDASA